MGIFDTNFDLTANETEIKKFSISFAYRLLQLLVIGIFCIVIGVIIPKELEMFRLLPIVMFIVYVFIYMFYIPLSNVYMITNERFLIKHGWLAIDVKTLPISKITNAAMSQGIFERFVTRSGTIKIETAGTENDEIKLYNISNPLEIENILADLISKKV